MEIDKQLVQTPWQTWCTAALLDSGDRQETHFKFKTNLNYHNRP